jgi:Helix-turn-helix domain
MTQCDMVLKHLQSGRTLTPLQAARLYDICRVADRARDLRNKGYAVKTQMVKLKSGKRIGVLSL